MKKYNYEWETINQVLKNKDTVCYFQGWGELSLRKLIDMFHPETTDEDIKNARKLWLKLKDAFNKEAQWYNENEYNSSLASVGNIKRREVCRPNWWDALGGDKYGDYRIITMIIEFLHNGEELETGTILFGS